MLIVGQHRTNDKVWGATMKYTIIGILIYGFCFFILWLIRPNSKIFEIKTDEKTIKSKLTCSIFCIATILICVLPMSLSPKYNGQFPAHRNQYELIADSIIDGKVSFDYEVDEKLLEMDNPYDPSMRESLDVDFHWDHAFYNGKYYMYFGIVPAIVVFVPYKLITGTPLTTYHATQIFTAFFIIGLFALFNLLRRRFFNKINDAIFILSCVAFSFMSVWYIVSAPAMYCTAISSAICFEIWSVFFFLKAVYNTPSDNKAIAYATLGALFGALVFGCRPPIALANLIVIPLVITFIHSRKTNGKINKPLLLKLLIVLIPYILVAISLMWYNYIRFENVFEFGQTYQLTIADQSNYGNMLSRFNLEAIFHSVYYYFIRIPSKIKLIEFGMFLTYPIFIFLAARMLHKKCLSRIAKKKLVPLVITLILSVLIIIIMDATFSPWPLARYRMDFYWLVSIVSFIFIGFVYETLSKKKVVNSLLALLLFLSIVASIAMFLEPYDSNFTDYYAPQSLEIIKHIFTLGIK